MSTPQESTFPQATDLSPDDYLFVGLATCYVKEEGEVREIAVIEPVPSSTSETLLAGVPTSYRFIQATTLGHIIDGEAPQRLAGFPEEAQFCHDFLFRASSAARTFLRNPAYRDRVAVGSSYDQLNYSTERKRVLNAKHVVSAEDNVKQHSHTHQVL
jgi:hypothetical protein